MNIVKRILKWAGITLGALVLIPLMIMVLFYTPAVQNWAVQKAIGIASEETGMKISLERVGITFLLDIELENLTAIQGNDTLLHTGKVLVDLDFSKILQSQVGIEGIDIREGRFNSLDLIPQVHIDGHLGLLHLDREETDLSNNLASLSAASIEGCDLAISLRDTTVVDTTESSPLPWTIQVGRIDIKESRIFFRMPGDTLAVSTDIRNASISSGEIDLGNSIYQVGEFGLKIDTLLLSMKDSTGGYTRIPLSMTSLSAEGLRMDTLSLGIEKFLIHTTDSNGGNTEGEALSRIEGNVFMDFRAFTPDAGGKLSTNISATLSHPDILAIAQDFIPEDLAKIYPAHPLKANFSVHGNIDSLSIDTLLLHMPSTIDIRTGGHIAGLLDEGGMRAHLLWDVSTMDLNFVRRYLGLYDVRIPRMNLSADTRIDGNAYKADALLKRGKGTLHARASLDLDNMAYSANLFARDMDMSDFLPKDSIGLLTVSAKLKGHGTDPYSRATGMEAEIDLKHLEYKQWVLDNARFTAMLERGKGVVEVHCSNDILMANACASAEIGRGDSKIEFDLSMNKINLQALGITEDSLVVSMAMNLDGNTDLKQTHRMNGSVHSIELTTPKSTYYPLDLNLEVNTNEESILARTNAGNLWLQFRAKEGMDSLLFKTNAYLEELNNQREERYLDRQKLRALLPRMDFHILCGNENPLASITRSMFGATFNEISMDIISNPETGLNGQGHMHKLNTSAVVLDSTSWNFQSLEKGIQIMARVKNGPRNKVVNFESKIDALITPRGLEAHFLFTDDKGRKGVDMGMKLIASSDSILSLHLTPQDPILAYRRFHVNDSNHVSIDKNNHILADMNLEADNGTSLNLYSTPNENAEQDVTLSVANFNLGEFSKILPFMPFIDGMLNGDVHFVQESEMATFSADMDVKKMAYEGSPLGDIGMEMIYFPNTDGSHLMDGIFSQNNRNIATLSGRYWTLYDEEEEDGEGEGQIEAQAQLLRLPLNMANGFVSDNMARMEGYITGLMDIQGPVSSPRLSGALSTDSMHICSDPYSVDLRIIDDTVVIEKNFLDLDKIQAYANGNNPLTLDGTIDFAELSKPKLNLSVVARDFNLINAPKRKGAEAYGKVYVDLFGRMQGSLDNIDIRGQLNVNGKTNVTYVMQDSPLVVDDQLNSLVTFTDFSDTTEIPVMRLPEQNVKMDIQVNIDEATTIHCLMSEDGRDNIELEGGGDLRMTYDMLSGMRLFGRYTVLSGNMDYSLVVMSLKDFRIKNGSYVEFMGDMMNPKLNISASERKKASVSSNNRTRSVNFDVGLKISQTLSDLGLEFTLEAPEDITVQNELAAMSTEERGRAAVAMLTTGMYLSPNSSGGGGSFDATSALNSFLNSQISNIAGKALSTIDIGFGIDNSKSATGASQTDYNFSFAKRFWGNRISVIIGGKVSSGNDAQNTGMSIINNVSVEYRLDNTGTRYVKAFYNKDTESILDSEVMEMGASLVLRRKTENLGELFIFRDSKKNRYRTRQSSAKEKDGGQRKPTEQTSQQKAE